MTNTAGEPIIGATVLEKGNTTNGTITDIDGNFTINLPANATLSISYIGYITQRNTSGVSNFFQSSTEKTIQKHWMKSLL